MKKTRTLSRDLGRAGDLKYDSLNRYFITADPLTSAYAKLFDKRLVDVFDQAEANRTRLPTLSLVNWAGYEEFDSSEWLRPRFNNLVHSKTRMYNYAYAFVARKYNDPHNYNWRPYLRKKFPANTQVTPDLGKLSFEQWDSAARRAWWEMKPRFEGEVSMLNFLFELKDFKTIVKHALKLRSISSISKEMRLFKSRLRAIDKRLVNDTTPLSSLKKVRDTGASAAKITAQIHLINAFAIQPLINDWGNILAQAGEVVRDVQQTFYEKGQAAQIRNYSESITLSDNVQVTSAGEYFTGYGTRMTEVFTATLEYKYNYAMRSDSDAFLKYWGLNLTPEVIWNSIPFTFLIDYFFKVGNSLHMMSVDPNVKLLPMQYCESICREYHSGLFAVKDSRANMVVNGEYPINNGTPITGYMGSKYERRVKPPNKGLATPRLTLPSGRQGANMAALAYCFLT